jgi:uroporphyrinogen-III synthase
MFSLRGVGVLVTRPEPQALPLCRLLEAQGAIAVRFPVMNIQPLEDRHELLTRLGTLENFDLVIFTSANAVRYGASLLAQTRDLAHTRDATRAQDPTRMQDLAQRRAPAQAHPVPKKREFVLAAIGPATARALDEAGHRVSITPDRGFDSENLLRHPQLERLSGQRILLVKGNQGRELLQQELTRRGAEVVTAEVYKRQRAVPTAAALEDLKAKVAAGAIHVITATSLEIAANLLALATPALRSDLDGLHWLVPGARVAQGMRELGLSAPLLEADSADDHDLLAAIVRWRSSVSGA